MIGSDVATRVSRLIGDEDKLLVTDTDYLLYITDGQKDVVRKTECLQDVSTIATSANTSEYTIPSNVLFIKRAALKDRTLTPLDVNDVSVFAGAVNASGFNYNFVSGYYYTWGSKIYVNPTDCGSGIDIDLFYVKLPSTPSVISSTLDLPDQYLEDLTNYVLARAFERLDDDRARSQWTAYEAKLSIARNEAHFRGVQSYPAIRLSEADWDY